MPTLAAEEADVAVKDSVVTVTTSATRLGSATQTDGAPGSGLLLFNNSAVIVYIGGPTVTTATGFPVAAASNGPGFTLDNSEGVYGIVVSGTAEVRVIEAGV